MENKEKAKREPIRVNFAPNLVPLVINGEKDLTWRINDEKGFQVGDELILWLKGKDSKGIQVEAEAEFGRGRVVEVWEKPFREFTGKEKDGHERFNSDKEMVDQYKKYYGDWVNPETVVKIIRFELLTGR